MVERAHADHVDGAISLRGECELLGLDLAARVGGDGLERSRLGHRSRRRGDLAVLLGAADDDDSSYARRRACREQVGGPADVDLVHGVRVVPRRTDVR